MRTDRMLAEALAAFRSGDYTTAERSCRQVLRREPGNPRAVFLAGMALLARGQIPEATRELERAAKISPDEPAVRENLGLAYLLADRGADAERELRAATKHGPSSPILLMRLGLALDAQGKTAEALQVMERAADYGPETPEVYLNLGNLRARAGEPDAAGAAYRHVLELQPQHPDAQFNLARLSQAAGDASGAEAAYRQLLASHPGYADAWVNLSVVLQDAGRTEEALGCLRQVLELQPDSAAALSGLARAMAAQGRFEEAREGFVAALRVAPGMNEALEGLAGACLALGRTQEGITRLRELLQREPGNARALDALARALFETAALDEAEATARKALAATPISVEAYSVLAEIAFVRGQVEKVVALLEEGYSRTRAHRLLGMLVLQLRRACEWEKWRTAWDQIAAVLNDSADLGTPFALLCEPTSATDQLAYARRWSAAHFRASDPPPPPQPRDRVRIGYLSSDFHEHATAYLLAEVLELHDRGRFEVFAYSYGPEDRSPMRKRLRSACEHFVDIAWEPDDVAARRIAEDALDILVDLKGYTLGARTAILARRPAAIQVSWIGYPGTMGAAFINYLIADPVTVPPGAEGAYSERVLRLPHCYQPNDRKRSIAEPRSRAEYGLPESGFVFACFNQAFKVTPEVFAAWMRLLGAVPGSVLWLLEDNPAATRNLKAVAQSQGIAAERLVFAPRRPLAEHLARYRVADLALDTFPYTSHTTASDALWAGCPLVALCGGTFAARVSSSILRAANLPELVTESLDAYERLAQRLATEPALFSAARGRVDAARSGAPLFAAPAFTRDLEQLYLDLLAR